MTQADVLELFIQVSAIKDGDEFLLITDNQDGTVSATKITAELVRAYLNKGYEVTIGDDGYFYIGGVKTTTEAQAIPLVQHSSSENIISIEPNKLHVWGEVSNLVLSLANGSLGKVNEYMIQFTCPSGSGTVLNLPSSVKWVDEPDFNAGNTYQVSIVNNLAIYAGWEAATV